MSASDVDRQAIECTIRLIRGHRVILDADLARLYGVKTKNLNKAVQRNSPTCSRASTFSCPLWSRRS